MSVAPYDEAAIQAHDRIIRRVDPAQHVLFDENTQRDRLSSKLYKVSSDQSGGMSVDVEALMLAQGIDPKVFVTTPRFTGSVAFSADQIRNLGLWVGYDPIPDNPYHGEVWTSVPTRKFSKGQTRGLAQAAEWYVALPDVDIR